MKKAIISIGMVIGLVAVSTILAYGQSSEMYRVHIPFDFSIGKKYFSAGDYSLEVKGSEQKLFIMRDAKGKNAYATASSPAGTLRDRAAVLEFQRRGPAYSLVGVRARAFSANLPKPSEEPNLGLRTEPMPVIVALRK